MKNTKLYKFLFEEEEPEIMDVSKEEEESSKEKIMGPPESNVSEPTIDFIPSTVSMPVITPEPTP